MINSLYENFKHWSSKGSVWIISDPHFGDSDCRLMGPEWPEPEQYVKLINKTIHKQDTLICLGDVGDETYVRMINCEHKVLITGNHDKGASAYKKETWDIPLDHINPDYSLDDWEKDFDIRTDKEIREIAKDNRINVIGKGWSFHKPFTFVTVDDKLFDEVYTGPLFIADRILLSHEPIFGLESFCVNIHGHCHNGQHRYNGHINLAADVVDYKPFNLGKAIKDGMLSGVENYHRQTIDRATENPMKKD